jgi:excisionase family DNA binding protein
MPKGAHRRPEPIAPEVELHRVYTTGEAARLCHLSQQTIIRCFDAGRLNGFRVPGSRFRRIPGADLLRFIESNSIPALGRAAPNGRLPSRGVSGSTSPHQPPSSSHLGRLLLISSDGQAIEGVRGALETFGRSVFELHAAATPFEAGLALGVVAPNVVVLDLDMPGVDSREVLRSAIQSECVATHERGGARQGEPTQPGQRHHSPPRRGDAAPPPRTGRAGSEHALATSAAQAWEGPQTGRHHVLIVGSALRHDAEEELLALGARSVHRKPLDAAAWRRALKGVVGE